MPSERASVGPFPPLQRVSVVIATYNRAQLVTATVADVLEQEAFGAELEVIVVDDGSTDGTAAALAPFEGHIIYRRIPHAGRPAVPRNVALELASGELVAFQDDDDLWFGDKLRIQVESFRREPGLVMSYGNAELLSADGTPEGHSLVPPEHARSGNVVPELLVRNFIAAQTPVVPRGLLERLGGFDESPELLGVEDYELWLRVAACGRVRSEGRALAYHRYHEASISRVDDDEGRGRLLSVYAAFLRVAPPEYRPLARRRLAEGHLERAAIRKRRGSASCVASVLAGSYHRARLYIGT